MLLYHRYVSLMKLSIMVTLNLLSALVDST